MVKPLHVYVKLGESDFAHDPPPSVNQMKEKEYFQRGIFSITHTYLRSPRGNCSLKMSIPTKLFHF